MLRIIVASAIAFVTAMSAPIGSASAQSFGSSYTPGAVCHVAYVDVAANPNPNELARKAADESARDFKCGKDEVQFVGARGRAAELAKR